MIEDDEKMLARIVLTSKYKRGIIKSLAEKDMSYLELIDQLHLTSTCLSYHILRMRAVGLLTRRHTRYTLSKIGEKIAKQHIE